MFNISLKTNPETTTAPVKSVNSTGYRAVIIDIEGNILQEHYIGNLLEKIDIRELPDRIYILQIFNKNKQMVTYKMFQKSQYHKTYNII
jgi:hypothetical protein